MAKLWAWLKSIFGAEKAQVPAVAKPKRKRAVKKTVKKKAKR